MRYAFIALILCACGVVRGEDAAAAPSVINHGQPASVMTTETAAAPTATADCCCNRGSCRTACCRPRGRVRFRAVTEGCDACTGQPVRSVTRGVIRGAGEVVDAAGNAVVNVITLPGRICRGGRCNCN